MFIVVLKLFPQRILRFGTASASSSVRKVTRATTTTIIATNVSATSVVNVSVVLEMISFQ